MVGSTVWKTIWNLKVPNATKMFLWKAINNLLPTKDNLLKRKVMPDKQCLICLREDESIIHILWNCPSTRDAWGCGPIRFQKTYGMGNSFQSLFEEMSDRCTIEELELLAVLAHNIWFRRNTIIHGCMFKAPSNVLRALVSVTL